MQYLMPVNTDIWLLTYKKYIYIIVGSASESLAHFFAFGYYFQYYRYSLEVVENSYGEFFVSRS